MNYHLLIVDSNSIDKHLQHCFVGTGEKNLKFNIGLWKDIASLKKGDKIIFFVQGIGKFFGIFEVTSDPFFLGNEELQSHPVDRALDNGVILQYRALIRPYIVYPQGIPEFELIDILPPYTKDVLWSVIFRKLKGRRGCSPLLDIEYERIFKKLKEINKDNEVLTGSSFEFNGTEICVSSRNSGYFAPTTYSSGVKQAILTDQYNEHHLHALLLEKLPSIVFDNPKWIGNEISAGAGMQSIDILVLGKSSKYSVIEIKKDEVEAAITDQLEKYILWLKYRVGIKNKRLLQPMIVAKKITGKRKQNNRIAEFLRYNEKGLSCGIRYIEYEIYENEIKFAEIDYSGKWRIKSGCSV